MSRNKVVDITNIQLQLLEMIEVLDKTFELKWHTRDKEFAMHTIKKLTETTPHSMYNVKIFEGEFYSKHNFIINYSHENIELTMEFSTGSGSENGTKLAAKITDESILLLTTIYNVVKIYNKRIKGE
jgi:hypothetical protein